MFGLESAELANPTLDVGRKGSMARTDGRSAI